MDIKIRKAVKADIKDIKKILSYYFLDTGKVEKNLPQSIIAISGNKTVGCACLDIDNITELRSIAVLPGYRNKEIGSKMIDSILDIASDLTSTVYVRTTSPVFFEKKRFRPLQNNQKKVIWKECEVCDKFDVCKQKLMKIELNP